MRFIESLYIHFPYCAHLCNYCDFYKVKTSEKSFQKYQHYLEKSWSIHECLLKEENYRIDSLQTLYLGGGTPSLWGEDGIIFLKNFFKNAKISLEDLQEATLEINPATWSKKELDLWQELGIDRFSIGVQCLNQDIFPYLDRHHTLEDVEILLLELKTRGLNFSVDLMLGLPKSLDFKRDLKEELEKILKFNPHHLSLYILTIKKFYKWQDFLPTDDYIAKEFSFVSEYLTERNFLHYEVSNFSKRGFESLHNKKYWESHAVAALGPSATGYLAEKSLRYKWSSGWSDKVPEFSIERLTASEKLLENIYLKLRTQEGVELRKFFKDLPLERMHLLASRWEKEKYVIYQNGHVYPLGKGFLFMDTLMDNIFTAGII